MSGKVQKLRVFSVIELRREKEIKFIVFAVCSHFNCSRVVKQQQLRSTVRTKILIHINKCL